MEECILKPCPFCGGEAYIQVYPKATYGFSGTIIRCSCGASVRVYSTRAKIMPGGRLENRPVKNHKYLAVKKWNKRFEAAMASMS